ncbi:hypothetical protein B484DRAFT_469660, partial [Ochromonadaceae sp. CCMP2298]
MKAASLENQGKTAAVGKSKAAVDRSSKPMSKEKVAAAVEDAQDSDSESEDERGYAARAHGEKKPLTTGSQEARESPRPPPSLALSEQEHHEIDGLPVTRDEFLRWGEYDSEDEVSEASEERSSELSASRSGDSGSDGDDEGAPRAGPVEILHSRTGHPSEAITRGRFAETPSRSDESMGSDNEDDSSTGSSMEGYDRDARPYGPSPSDRARDAREARGAPMVRRGGRHHTRCPCDDCKKKVPFEETTDMPDLLAEDSDDDDDPPTFLIPTRAPPRGARVARYVDDISVACPMEVCGTTAAGGDEDKEFIIDSGCTAHCSGEPQNQLANFVPRQESISLGNAEHRVQSYGRGSLGPLRDVMYAPGMSFSMPGSHDHSHDHRRKLYHVDVDSFGRGDVAAAGLEKEGSGKQATSSKPRAVVPYTFADNSKDIKGSFGSTRAGTTQGLNALELLHLRTGHSSEAVLKAGLKLNIFKGAQTTYAACRNLTLGPCEACLRGGMRADSVTVSSRDLSALKPMQEIGMDPVSLSTKTVDGNTVLNVGLCYGAKLMWAYPAKTDTAQSDVLRAIKRDYADPYGHVIET